MRESYWTNKAAISKLNVVSKALEEHGAMAVIKARIVVSATALNLLHYAVSTLQYAGW